MDETRKSTDTKRTASASLWVCALYHILAIHTAAATDASVRGATGSEERSALDQALMLVEILKSEYSRVLRENDELQGKNVLRAVDVQTCATTTEKVSQETLSLTKTENQNSNMLFQSTRPDKVVATHPPATPFQPWVARRSLNGFRHRRRWRPPAAYYYYDVPIRRSYDNGDYTGAHIDRRTWRRNYDYDYDKIGGPQPNITKPTTTTTTTSTTKSTTTTSTSTTTASIKQHLTASSTSTSPTTVKTVSEPSITRTTSEKSNRVKSHKMSNSAIDALVKGTVGTTAPNDIVTESISNSVTPTTEVAGISEMSATEVSSSPMSQQTHTDKIDTTDGNALIRPIKKKRLSLDITLSNANTANSIIPTPVRQPELSEAAAQLAKELGADLSGFIPRIPVFWRGSTKVYLSDSTRYPVPLPENHAFCYTNPHSALCRTFI